jgi:quinol monooxygenase YgiN
MYLLVAEILTRPGAEADYEALLRSVVRSLATEPCFVSFTIARSPGDPRLFMLHELWTSRSAYDEVRAGSTFSAYLAERAALVEMVSRRDWELVELVSPKVPAGARPQPL